MHELQAFALDLFYHDAQDGLLAHGVFGQEHQSGAILALLGHRNALKQNKLVRYLQHDAGAGASSVSALSASVAHVFEHLQRVVYQLVALVAVNVHYHAHATCVVLVAGIIQSLCLRPGRQR